MIAPLRPTLSILSTEFAVGDVVVAGSAIFGGSRNDVDVFTGNPAVFAKLLHFAKLRPELSIHPSLGFDTAELHERMSWGQCCVTCELDGSLHFGRAYTDSGELVFNPASTKAFPDKAAALVAAAKLVGRGYALPHSERMRAVVALSGVGPELFELVAQSLNVSVSPQTVYAVRRRGAVFAGGALRDIVLGERPKDIDIFVPGAPSAWDRLCNDLVRSGCEEVHFEFPAGKRVNLRKFIDPLTGATLDVIQYGFVSEAEHVVETFDFRLNMLWIDPGTGELRGPADGGAEAAVRDIRDRRLVVGKNMWFRAGPLRALRRWGRFLQEGFSADDANRRAYSNYVKEMLHVRA